MIVNDLIVRLANVMGISVFVWVIARGGGPDAFMGVVFCILAFASSEIIIHQKSSKKPTYLKVDGEIFV